MSAFQRRAPADALIEWTGERCVPWADHFEMIYEHYHRYLFALPFVRGRKVLDLACGEGYGAALLAEHAERVVGVDIDSATVAHARNRYAKGNTDFFVASMLDQDAFLDERFDVVVCFEALEHVEDHDAVAATIQRVLVPGGTLLISTPDRDIYSGRDGAQNPHHHHELDKEEFESWLRSMFPNVRIWTQAAAVGSLLLDASGSRSLDLWAMRPHGADAWLPTAALPSGVYLLAAASSSMLDDIDVRSSLLIDVERSFSRSMSDRLKIALEEVLQLRESAAAAAAKAHAMDQALHLADDRIRRLQRQVAELLDEAATLRSRFIDAEERDARLAAVETQLADVMESTSFAIVRSLASSSIARKLATPGVRRALRRTVRALTAPAHEVRRVQQPH